MLCNMSTQSSMLSIIYALVESPWSFAISYPMRLLGRLNMPLQRPPFPLNPADSLGFGAGATLSKQCIVVTFVSVVGCALRGWLFFVLEHIWITDAVYRSGCPFYWNIARLLKQTKTYPFSIPRPAYFVCQTWRVYGPVYTGWEDRTVISAWSYFVCTMGLQVIRFSSFIHPKSL